MLHLLVLAYCVFSLHNNFVRLSDNAKIWEDHLRQFLDQSRVSRKAFAHSTSSNEEEEDDDNKEEEEEEEKKEASNPLQEVWKMCQHLNPNGHDSGAYFKQVCLVGCVRAGVTRLDKNLVGVFDLRCETMCCSR